VSLVVIVAGSFAGEWLAINRVIVTYARSAEVIHGAVMQSLVWARVPGDVVFAVGAAAFALFVAR
jgi:nitric oxide reductase large subunit